MEDLTPPLPEGWRRIPDGTGKFYYLSRHPQVKIVLKSQLQNYHQNGRYLEMDVSDLDFGTRARIKKYKVSGDISEDQPCLGAVKKSKPCEISKTFEYKVTDEPEEPPNRYEWTDIDMEEEQGSIGSIDEKEFRERKAEELQKEKKSLKLETEKRRLEDAVGKLTLNPEEEVDHKRDLMKSAQLLNDARISFDNSDIETIDFNAFKSQLLSSSNIQDVLKSLKNCPEIQVKITDLEQSKLLEQLLRISTMPENPLTDFPLDINSNHYSKIVNFALQHSPDVMKLILKLTTKNEVPINENDVVRLAYMFSSLASAVSVKNNALKKLKSISTKNNGLTNMGLDVLANVGIFETSRSWRNDRDFLASLSDQILKSYARFSVAQVTFDNMDLVIANVMHHMTLPFLEFETLDTSSLSTQEKTFEEALEFFDIKTVDIMSEFNKDLFAHYQYVTSWTLGRILAKEVEGFSWLSKVFPKHYKHPNSENSTNKSNIFTQKPLNYSESSNADMIKIMELLQWQYLNLVAEQCEDKEGFKKDLKFIYSVDVEKKIRIEAEARVKEAVTAAGKVPTKQ